ncbi:hypothetical protein B0H17DRAFT_1184916 [Mycena rosella]|uniref:DUF6534 domain-containing protein n=1 Tax=Mycena rosella TaxID=1033263 RepID=A0AAD7G7H1_MYCRO|nr:hypothetical protein B0H17DRAFT_1184916 [Mycena rosella]
MGTELSKTAPGLDRNIRIDDRAKRQAAERSLNSAEVSSRRSRWLTVSPSSSAMATVDNTFGLMYNAVVISAVLYGAGIVQGWFYYQKYWRKDPMLNKILVALVMIFDTCQHVLLTESIYKYLVTGHLDELAFSRVVKTFIIEIYPTALIALLVRNFSVYRIYRLSKGNWILAGSVSILSLGSFASLLYYATSAVGFQDIAQLVEIKNTSIAIDVLGAGVDSLISIIMIYLLNSHKGDIRKTTDLLNHLVYQPVSLQSPPPYQWLAASPDTMVYIFWFLLLGSLYTNSLMVTLNARDYIRSRGNDQSIQMQSAIRFNSQPEIISTARQGLPSSDNHHIAIHIDKHTEVDLEEGDSHYSENSQYKRQI